MPANYPYSILDTGLVLKVRELIIKLHNIYDNKYTCTYVQYFVLH